MRRIYYKLLVFCSAIFLMMPDFVQAAGDKAEMLINVADTRRVTWGGTVFFLDLYNRDPFMFGCLCVLLTAALGGSLGFITDFFMKRTGLDLTSRKIVEH